MIHFLTAKYAKFTKLELMPAALDRINKIFRMNRIFLGLRIHYSIFSGTLSIMSVNPVGVT